MPEPQPLGSADGLRLAGALQRRDTRDLPHGRWRAGCLPPRRGRRRRREAVTHTHTHTPPSRARGGLSPHRTSRETLGVPALPPPALTRGLGAATGRSRRRPSGWSPATALSLSDPTPSQGTPGGWVPARPSSHRKRARRRAPAPPRRGLTGSQLQAAVPPAAPQRPLPALQDVVVLGLEQLHPRTPPPPPPPNDRTTDAAGKEGERGGRSRRSRAEKGGEGERGARSREANAGARAAAGSPAGPGERALPQPGASSGSGPAVAVAVVAAAAATAAARDAANQPLAALLKVQRGAGRGLAEREGAGLRLPAPARRSLAGLLSHPPREGDGPRPAETVRSGEGTGLKCRGREGRSVGRSAGRQAGSGTPCPPRRG